MYQNTYSPIYPYPNAYSQYVPAPQLQQPIVNAGPVMAWTQGGINGAKSYPTPPNSRVYLFDSEDECFYVKVTDELGRISSFRKFDYSEALIEEEPNNQTVSNSNNYVTRDEIKDIIKEALEEQRSTYRKGGYHNGKSSVRGTNESRNDGDVQ